MSDISNIPRIKVCTLLLVLLGALAGSLSVAVARTVNVQDQNIESETCNALATNNVGLLISDCAEWSEVKMFLDIGEVEAMRVGSADNPVHIFRRFSASRDSADYVFATGEQPALNILAFEQDVMSFDVIPSLNLSTGAYWDIYVCMNRITGGNQFGWLVQDASLQYLGDTVESIC